MPRLIPLGAYLVVTACLPRTARQAPDVPTRIFESPSAALTCAANAVHAAGFDVTDLAPQRSWFIATRTVPEVTVTSSQAYRTEKVTIAATLIEGSHAWRVEVSPLKGHMGGALRARQLVVDRCITPPGGA